VARDSFQVDLRGMVDLLSHHLYSSPRVYLRELVQNSADAITARAAVEPDCPRRIEIVPADVADDGCLHIHDTGIGLDAESIRSVLATIGASTKRDELGFARGSFLGQFGIGLLSCFLVCDEIVLHTRRVGAEQTWTWSGAADGTYTVTPAQTPRADPGTEVVLRPRGIEPLLGWSQVGALAELFAAYLPVELIVHTPDGPRDVGGRTFPWEDPTLTGGRRREAAERLSDDLLGIRPLDVIELADPVTGVHGFAFVTPAPAGRRAHHRLYAKRMLVGEAVEAILPDWAFFVRAVLDGDRLELTASRESLQDNEALAETRERLGDAIRRWLLRTAATDPDRMRRFLQVHHLGAKAMAAEDDEMLDIVAGLLPWETTRGQMSLADFAALDPVLRYAESIEDFRQIAPLASVGGVAVLNAGYAYDGELIRRWLARHPGSDARRIAGSRRASSAPGSSRSNRPNGPASRGCSQPRRKPSTGPAWSPTSAGLLPKTCRPCCSSTVTVGASAIAPRSARTSTARGPPSWTRRPGRRPRHHLSSTPPTTPCAGSPSTPTQRCNDTSSKRSMPTPSSPDNTPCVRSTAHSFPERCPTSSIVPSTGDRHDLSQ